MRSRANAAVITLNADSRTGPVSKGIALRIDSERRLVQPSEEAEMPDEDDPNGFMGFQGACATAAYESGSTWGPEEKWNRAVEFMAECAGNGVVPTAEGFKGYLIRTVEEESPPDWRPPPTVPPDVKDPVLVAAMSAVAVPIRRLTVPYGTQSPGEAWDRIGMYIEGRPPEEEGGVRRMIGTDVVLAIGAFDFLRSVLALLEGGDTDSARAFVEDCRVWIEGLK